MGRPAIAWTMAALHTVKTKLSRRQLHHHKGIESVDMVLQGSLDDWLQQAGVKLIIPATIKQHSDSAHFEEIAVRVAAFGSIQRCKPQIRIGH